MQTKIKYGKILAVVFLTVLIWVYADLALDVEMTVYNAAVSVATPNPKLWVSFNDEDSVAIEEIVLRGPAARIAEVKRRLKQRTLVFDFDPAQEKMHEPGEHTLLLLPFLQKAREIKEFGVKVESCKPDRLPVAVVGLTKKLLDVQCVDEGRNPIPATIDPAQVYVFVPEEHKATAEVKLTQTEIEQARAVAVDKKPYVELAEGQLRWADTFVKVTVPPQELLKEETIATSRLGFILSENLQGNYQVTVDNRADVMTAIRIRATPDAKRAYENMRYHVILEIFDGDEKEEEPLKRKLKYNFPEEYVRKDQIKLNQLPVEAKFKLIKLAPWPPSKASAGG